MNAQSTTQTKKRPVLIIIVAALAGLCILCVGASFAMDAMGLLPETTALPTDPPVPTQTIPSTSTPAEAYFKEHGGNLDVYIRILSMTDCSSLQQEFDQADANTKLQEPGTSQYKWSIGYMKAADDRMKEIGCYK